MILDSKQELIFHSDHRSRLYLDLSVDKKYLQIVFNQTLDRILNQNFNITIAGQLIAIKKKGPASIHLDSRSIHTRLRLELRRIGSILKYSLWSELELEFDSEIHFGKAMDIEFRTKNLSFSWLSGPGIKILGMDISVRSLANRILEGSKRKIETRISQAIGSRINIEEFLLLQFKRIHQFEMPLIDQALFLSIWVHSMGLAEIRSEKDAYVSMLCMEFDSSIKNTGSESKLDLSECTIAWSAQEITNSSIDLIAQLDYNTLNQMLSNYLSATEMSQDNRNLVIEDVRVSKDGDYEKVLLDLSGDFKGKIELLFGLNFERETQELSVIDVDLDFETNNLLHKTGLWFLKPIIRKRLEDSFKIQISQKKEVIQAFVDDVLERYSKDPSMRIQLDLQELILNELLLEQNYILLDFRLISQMKLQFG